MERIKSFAELQQKKEEIRLKKRFAEGENKSGQVVQIKVGMATCGIASGAKEIMKFLVEECEHLAIDAVIKQTGCLGYCYAEPMVEIEIPGSKPKVFGYVDKKKAGEIIEKYIMRGEIVGGEIAVSFQTIDETCSTDKL